MELNDQKEDAAAEDAATDVKASLNKDRDYEEVVQYVAEKLSDIVLDSNLLKKKGFLIAIDTEGGGRSQLDNEIELVVNHYKKLEDEYLRSQQKNLDTLKLVYDNKSKLLDQLRDKEQEYETRIKTIIPQEKNVLKQEANTLQEKIYKILKEIGLSKGNVVEETIDRFGREMTKVTKINREIQDEQNKELEIEHNSDKEANNDKRNFWTQVLEKYKDRFDKVMFRLQVLAEDGINNLTASFLIFLGATAALVAGWWFSIWTGPISPEQGSSGVDSSSVRIFFLDSISRFLANFTLLQITIGLAIYLVIVAIFSYLSYYLQVRFGFITPQIKKASRPDAGKSNSDDEQLHFNIHEDEDLLKIKMRSNNWWGFWLKAAPAIFALTPLLAIISYQNNTLVEGDLDISHLFSSLINQFIGTCIAVSFSTFTVLYFSRIAESKYRQQNASGRRGTGLFYVGFIIYSIMIVSMLLYHYPVDVFNDVRQIAIVGFFASCVATGFSLGYGYLFKSLHYDSESLLQRIDEISGIIYRYSRPIRLNYTSNSWLRGRISYLQQQMLSLIQKRQTLASAVAGGHDIVYVNNREITDQTATGKIPNPSTSTKQRGFWDFLSSLIVQKRKADQEAKALEERKYEIVYQLSAAEITVFAEKAEELQELNTRIKELKRKIDQLEAEELAFWRNEGTYRSIKDQILIAEKRIRRLSARIALFETQLQVETAKLAGRKTEEIILIREGYYTGVWFNNPGEAGIELTGIKNS